MGLIVAKGTYKGILISGWSDAFDILKLKWRGEYSEDLDVVVGDNDVTGVEITQVWRFLLKVRSHFQ